MENRLQNGKEIENFQASRISNIRKFEDNLAWNGNLTFMKSQNLIEKYCETANEQMIGFSFGWGLPIYFPTKF